MSEIAPSEYTFWDNLKQKYINNSNWWTVREMCAEWVNDLKVLKTKLNESKKNLCSNLYTQFLNMYHFPDYEVGENQYWTTGFVLNDYNSVSFCNLIHDIIDRRIRESPYFEMKFSILSDLQRQERAQCELEMQKLAQVQVSQQTCDIREIITRLQKIVNHL
jgi:hypothetical protein